MAKHNDSINEKLARMLFGTGKKTGKMAIKSGVKTIAVTFKATKFTTKLFEKAVSGAYKAINEKSGKFKGTHTMKVLGQNNTLKTIDVDAVQGMKDFSKIARKYGIQYAVKLDKSTEIPTYTVFFKSKDVDLMTSCFKEYMHSQTKKNDKKKSNQQEMPRESALKKLEKFKEKINIETKSVEKEKVLNKSKEMFR